MTNKKVYLWESAILERGAAELGPDAYQAYLDLIVECAAERREGRGLTLVFTGKVIGDTGEWPVAINLWEVDGWDGMVRVLNAEYMSRSTVLGTDDQVRPWWIRAARVRTRGADRLLVGADFSPTLHDIVDRKIVGNVLCHEIVQLPPMRANEYLARMEHEWLPLAQERLGMRLFGCYKTAQKNDSEVITIWAMRDFEQWSAMERAFEEDPEVARWKASAAELGADWLRYLIFPHPATSPRSAAII
jgi:hypothetical protein